MVVSIAQLLAAIDTEADENFRKKIRKINHRYLDMADYLKIDDGGKLVHVKKEPIKHEADSKHGQPTLQSLYRV
jgi:hypothetical protein